MNDARSRVDEQTAIRRAMLAHGYTPLANKEKMCLLKQWPQIEVDEAAIDEWSTMLAYQTTGLRIEAPLCVVDVDIDDYEMVMSLWSMCREKWGMTWTEDVLVRYGSGAKEAWLFRVDEPFHVPPGPKFVRPGEDPETDEAHKVELFGGGSARQIGAYGVHTAGKIDYEWVDNVGPAVVDITELPELTKAQVFEIYALYAELLAKHGWVRVPRYDPAEWAGVETVYDLTPEQEVVEHKRGRLRVDELDDGDRVRLREISGDGNNTSRGLVHVTDRGPAVWDAETGVTHMLVTAEPADLNDTLAKLREGLQAAGVVLPVTAPAPRTVAQWSILEGCDDLEGWPCMSKMVENMQQRYLHFPAGKGDEEIVDAFSGVGYNKGRLATALSRYAMELETGETYAVGDRAGEPKTKLVNPVTQFLASPETTIMEGYQFVPGNPSRLIETDAGLKLNVYEPPRFPDDPLDAAWFEEFLAYLVPDEEERDWLRNWVAYKVQHPDERGVGVVLVTSAFGTGRNVLMKLLRAMLGDRWCGDVPAGVLLGSSGQSQYDDMLMNKALVTCDEIALDGASYDKRMAAYERLKTVVDPYPQLRSLNRKGLSHVVSEVYYSALLASNHPTQALPLPGNDRRFAVLACTRQPLKPHRPDIKALVDRALPPGKAPHGGLMAGLYAYLQSVETDAEAFYSVPETGAKRTLVGDNEGEVEETIRRYIDKLPDAQPCFWFDDLVRRGEDWLRDRGAVRLGFKRHARALLRAGFAGWDYPDRATKVRLPGREVTVTKGVVWREGASTTPDERGEWLDPSVGTIKLVKG